MTPRPGPWASGRFDVEGHRGARGLVVENTLASFAAAYDAGVTGVELDVRLTADGHVVVWHDPVLQPLKCRSTGPDLVGARVADLTLAQLRTVDVGSQTLAGFPGQRPAPGARISTLVEVLPHGRRARARRVVDDRAQGRPARRSGRSPSRRRLLEGVLAARARARARAAVLRALLRLVGARAVGRAGARGAPLRPRGGLGDVGAREPVDRQRPGGGVARRRVRRRRRRRRAGHLARARPRRRGLRRARTRRRPCRAARGRSTTRRAWSQLVEAGVDGLVTDYPDRALSALASLSAGPA